MGNDPVPRPGSVDLTQQRKDRAAHALAAVRDLEAAIQAEIEGFQDRPDGPDVIAGGEYSQTDEVVYLAADWLNDNAMDVIEGLT